MIEKDRKERFSEYVRKRRQLKRWHRATVLLAALALVVTVAFMVMPAVTLENGSGMLNCSLDLHEHTSGCYDTEGELTCGYADFVVHTHTADCYDDSGALICPLPEIAEHTHTDECYTEERVLVCALEETQTAEHEHTDGCYTVREGAQSVCGLTEGEGHVHTADCYAEAEPVLICEQAEGEEHTHTAECYAEAEPELICGLEESEPHEHTLDCYSEEDIVLSCEYAGPAEPGHTHTDECYEIQRVLTCSQEEIVLHTHTADCYDESGALICGKLEVYEHVHDASCFPAPEPTEEPLPTPEPTVEPTAEATPEPTAEPTAEATPEPTVEPTAEATPEPTAEPTAEATPEPTPEATPEPTASIDPDATSWATVEKPGYDPDSPPLAANSFISLMNEQEGTDFGQHITDTTFEVQNGNVWEPVDGSVTDGANIRVTINYAIPEGIVTQNNRTIYYQLPEGIALEKDETGRVTIGNDEVGYYTITEGGLITITFDEDFANGDAFSGNIHFQGTVSLTGTGEDQEITFGGDGGTITVVPEEKEYNLGISKVGVYVRDEADAQKYGEFKLGINIVPGHVIYTVEVGSDKNSDGSNGVITVTDSFTHNPVDGVVTYDENNLKIYKRSPDINGGYSEPVAVTGYTLEYTHQQNGKEDAQTSSFTITGLPALQPGEYYMINYSASIDFGTVNSPNGYIAVPNTATAQDTSNTVKANATVSVSGNMVSKLVTENEGTGNLQWTVTLNEDGRDLSGMKFSDTMLYTLNGTDVNYNLEYITNLRVTAAEINDAGQQVSKGDVTDAFSALITYSDNGAMTVTFPAVGNWPAGLGSNWVYRLVYETPFPEDAGADAAIAFQNTARLDDYSMTVSWKGTVPDTGYGLVKESTGRDLNTGTNVGTIDWRSTITYPSDNVNLYSIQYMDWIPDAYYTNSGVFADGTHYTTLSTLRDTLTIQTALEQTLEWGTDFTVSVVYVEDMPNYGTFAAAWDDTETIFSQDLTDVTNGGESDKPIALFCITFKEAALGKLAGSRQLYISYQTLVNRNNITDGRELTISNVGVIQGNTVRAWLRTAFHEQLKKQVSSTGTAPSGDDYNLDSDVYVDGQVDIDLGDTGGKLYYRILFYNYGDTISFHDNMLEQFDGNIAFEQQMRIYNVITGDVRTVTTRDYLNSDGKYDGDYTLNNLVQFKDCIIGLYYSIDVSGDPELEGKETYSYTNTINWDDVGTDSATANVTNSESTLTKQSVQETENGENLVYYYVVINPASRDLHPASNQLELRDTLTLPTGAEAVIRLETIGLYHYDAANVYGHYLGKEITEEEFDDFKVEAEPGTENTYTFTVPDKMACVVVYAYEIDSGTSALDEITVNNTASLLGRAVISAGDEVIISAQDSGGTVNRAKLTIYKYAGNDRANLLDDVLFELARYEEQGNGNYAWVQTSITAAGRDGYFITGGDNVPGAIILNFLDEGDGDGTHYNTLYRLTEFQALDGYELDPTPRYYVWGRQGATAADTQAAMANALNSADITWDQVVFIPFGESKTEYISNAPTTTSIKVDKIWQDIDGKTLTENLPESVTVTLYRNGVKYEGEDAEVTLSAENNWSYTWKNLPKEDDENHPYTYTVVETPVDGFETSYRNNEGITDGTIIVINKETAVYVLPETGGTGAWRILALALVTLSLGTLCVLQIRRARRSRH